MTHPRLLISDGAFSHTALNALGGIFDEVWQSVLPEVSDNAMEIEIVRDRLATLVLELARDGQLGALQITRTAGRLTRQTLGIWHEPHSLGGPAHQLRCRRLAVNRMTEHIGFNDAEGTAALGICESLLLALTDLKIISEQDVRGLLTDVATTHQEAAASSLSPEKHQAVIAIVQRILAGTNNIRQ